VLGRCSTTSATPPILFVLVIFQIGSHIYAWAGLNHHSPIYASSVDGVTGVPHHGQLCIHLDGVSRTLSWLAVNG
jgi:hypothetical protein